MFKRIFMLFYIINQSKTLNSSSVRFPRGRAKKVGLVNKVICGRYNDLPVLQPPQSHKFLIWPKIRWGIFGIALAARSDVNCSSSHTVWRFDTLKKALSWHWSCLSYIQSSFRNHEMGEGFKSASQTTYRLTKVTDCIKCKAVKKIPS